MSRLTVYIYGYAHGKPGKTIKEARESNAYCRGEFECSGLLDRLAMYEDAEETGRLVMLPPFEASYNDIGLHVKYRVYKARNGEPVKNCFVLRPDKDPAAIAALLTYADITDNEDLRDDLRGWMESLRRADQ